jgi:hypothetical protein
MWDTDLLLSVITVFPRGLWLIRNFSLVYSDIGVLSRYRRQAIMVSLARAGCTSLFRQLLHLWWHHVAATVRHSRQMPALPQRGPGDDISPTSVSLKCLFPRLFEIEVFSDPYLWLRWVASLRRWSRSHDVILGVVKNRAWPTNPLYPVPLSPRCPRLNLLHLRLPR